MRLILRFFAILLCFAPLLLGAQNSIVRGNVFHQDNGEPLPFATIVLKDTKLGAITDVQGFYSIPNVPAGNYRLVVSYTGFEPYETDIVVKVGEVVYQRVLMTAAVVDLNEFDVSSQREMARTEVQISKLAVTQKQIKSLPSTGGEADIAQYLTVLPGVVSSGDQGGQLYIRGGAPVQNKILLDGMVIYNPFHSIGLFSVFETEAIRSVDVLTGGYNAQYGGRISAIVDIKTRDGNKKRLSGLVSGSPFQTKFLFEGPLKPLKSTGGGSVSFLFTGKRSLIDQTSKVLYPNAVDTNFYAFAARDTSLSKIKPNLPYNYTDLYGKISFNGENGSKLDLFGFHFSDQFNFLGLANLNWTNSGGGARFTVLPGNSNVVMNGTVGFSKYDISLKESDGRPRMSSVTNYNASLNFTYTGLKESLDYGFEIIGFNTDFSFRNLVGISFDQKDFTTELAGYAKYRREIGKLVIEPGFRIHYYASQTKISLEPRVGMKYNVNNNFRLKAAGGIYRQNLISTANDLDVVNFFTGYLAGPEETLFKPGTTIAANNRLQTAWHAVVGAEIDFGKNITVNVEPYLKNFSQLININRNKLQNNDPNYVIETGKAYGIDFTFKYDRPYFNIWATYSLARVTRFDGVQEFPTVFDRRHNANLLMTYIIGKKHAWEASARLNYGSAFPFTQTQGFYQQNPYTNLGSTDVLTGNYPIGTLLSSKINGGRLSDYHRLDVSLKHLLKFSKYAGLEIVASATNVYNRKNIFYVDRITNRRVHQLPFLPSLGATLKF
jgi:hypothetical protein